ncbi:hypothetical protein BH10PSE14_BH10PSE14_14110 [soil metagenome]
MMMVMGFLVFAAAFAASAWVFAATLVPAMPRIIALLHNGTDLVPARQPALVLNENRVRSRLRSAPAQPARMKLRAAA